MQGLRILPLVAGLLCTACGYEFVRYRTASADVQRVAVERLRNDSVDPGYGDLVTDAIQREVLRRGALALAEASADADLVVSGHVAPIQTSARSLDSTVLVLEYEVRVTLGITVARPDGSEFSIPAGTLQARELYFASADVEALRKNRQEALRRVASVLASRVHDSLSEGFAR